MIYPFIMCCNIRILSGCIMVVNESVFRGAEMGYSRYDAAPDAFVAQGIEQPPPKRQATRSNRVEGTIFWELIIWKNN